VFLLQIEQGVVFSTYEVRVDRMTVLRGNATEQQLLLPPALSNSTRVVSMVAFRYSNDCIGRHICQAQLFSGDGCLPTLSTLHAYRHLVPHCRGNVRTPARYFQSANASLTAGTGTVRELAVIARVGAQTLLLRHFAPPSLVVVCSGASERRPA